MQLEEVAVEVEVVLAPDAAQGVDPFLALRVAALVVARLNAEVLKALGDPDVRHKLEELGFALRGSTPEELRALTRDQLAKYARLIKDMGIANE